MSRRFYQLTQPGWAIVLALVLLIVTGIASIYVTDTHYVSGHDGPKNAIKQCVFVLVSVLAGACILRIGYQELGRHCYAIFALALVSLVPLLIAKEFRTDLGGLTAPRNGAYRWIKLPGFQAQPSEFVKLSFVMALAWYLRYRKNYRRLLGLMLPIAISALPLFMILRQPDLGTVLLLTAVLFVMLFIAGARVTHLAAIGLIAAAAAPLAWGQIKQYQRARVAAVFLQSKPLRDAVIADPDSYQYLATRRQAKEWAASAGYQLVHAKNAVGAGALLGYGWGKGIYVRNQLLPDRHNDFVFALIGHQWGLVGCVVILTAYGVIITLGVRIASVTTDPYGRLLAVGVVGLIATEVVIGVGMTIGLMPITGMTLPFVSYGGSSLLMHAMAIALVISVSQQRPFLLAPKPFDFGRRRRLKDQLAEYEAVTGSGERGNP